MGDVKNSHRELDSRLKSGHDMVECDHGGKEVETYVAGSSWRPPAVLPGSQ